MESYGFSEQTRELISSLYKNNIGDVITNHEISEQFEIKTGIRQGDPISPTIWVLFLDPIIQYIKAQYQGYNIKGINITSLNYADDMILITTEGTELYKMFQNLKDFCEYNNLSKS